MKRILVGLLFMLVPASGNCGMYTGNEIFPQCGDQFVIGYIAGGLDKADADLAPLRILFLGFYDKTKHVEQTAKLENSVKLVQGYCIPKGVTLRQMSDVYCKYLKENPATRHEGAASLLHEALKLAWPCDK